MPRDFKSRPTVNGAQIGLLSEAGAGISGTFSFAPTASIERHRITDSNVLTSSYILGELRRPVVAEVDDYGWEYDANVVEIGAGYFDIEVEISVLGELADDEFKSGISPFTTVYDSGLSNVNQRAHLMAEGRAIAYRFSYTGFVTAVSIPLSDEGSGLGGMTTSLHLENDVINIGVGTPSGQILSKESSGKSPIGSNPENVVFSFPPVLLNGFTWAVLNRNGWPPNSGTNQILDYNFSDTGGTNLFAELGIVSPTTWSTFTDQPNIKVFGPPITAFETLNYDYSVI